MRYPYPIPSPLKKFIMKFINKTANELALNKSYSATTRFCMNEDGNIEQRTVLYEHETGSQLQPVFQTKHCKVQITSGGLLIRFKFSRRNMSLDIAEDYTNEESELIFDFLRSEAGQRAIELAEQEILELANRKNRSAKRA